MSEHAELDALADALAAESDGVALPEHLQSCATCGAALADLRIALGAVARDLSTLPEVPAVPEALERSAVPTAAAATVLPESVTSLDDRRGVPRWLLAAGGIAAAAVLVVGGGLLLASNSTDTSSNATAAKAPAQVAISATGTNYHKDDGSLQSALPRLLGGKQEALDAAGSPSRAAGVAAPRVSADPLARLRTRTGLAACIASLSGPGDTGTPLALDYAAYDGQPALVVVLPSAKASKVDIWVVGAGCSQLESDLLLYVKADRPS